MLQHIAQAIAAISSVSTLHPVPLDNSYVRTSYGVPNTGIKAHEPKQWSSLQVVAAAEHAKQEILTLQNNNPDMLRAEG